MNPLEIAIVGAGPSGLAAASLLKKSGHRITVFEKFETPRPLGAGLLLQPTGLAVLATLGLDGDIIARGSKIHTLYGKVSGKQFATLNIAYADLGNHLFGVGTHRNSLFTVLYEHVQSLGIPVQAGMEIMDAKERDEKMMLVAQNGTCSGPYDLVIDASGQKSHLRKKYAAVKLDKPYPYGALWATVKLTDPAFDVHQLTQRYREASRMAGVLPVGKLDGDGQMHAAFFWSMRVRDHAAWRAQPLDTWKQYVQDFWPETASILSQFTTHDDLTFATYADGVLKRYHAGAIAFIGDSAHCSSPQLGQGANLGLVDALLLSRALETSESVVGALAAYSKQRRKHVWFYQTASRALTPFFQSDSWIAARIRVLYGVACMIPFTRKLATYVLSGTCTGVLSRLDPGEWSPGYGLLSEASKAATA